VCQILEVDDEWNILKSTLHWRGVQNISITLAILMEFLVNSLFHETKIPMVDMKVQVSSNYSKRKLWKKWNLQAPWGMEDSTLPSVGASFKKWRCCRCTRQRNPGPCNMQGLLNFFLKRFPNFFIKKWLCPNCIGNGLWPAGDCWLLPTTGCGCPLGNRWPTSGRLVRGD
jgi:hypothetical protein